MDLNKNYREKRFCGTVYVDEITYICKTLISVRLARRGRKQACEYMAKVLREDCGCDRVQVEASKKTPAPFLVGFTLQ